jgi:hypothetical protein
MSYLFIKKSVSKKEKCVLFSLKIKNLKNQKKKQFWWVFWVGFLLPTLVPGPRRLRHPPQLLLAGPLERPQLCPDRRLHLHRHR